MSLEPLPGVLSAIGNTPLVALDQLRPPGAGPLWGKLESFNPGGSAKDRTARALVRDAQRRGVLTKGSVVVESSSGNLGVALARGIHHPVGHLLADAAASHRSKKYPDCCHRHDCTWPKVRR